MLTQGKQMSAIAGDDDLDPGCHRTGEDQVVIRVAADRLGPARGGVDQFGCEVDQKLLGSLPAVFLEAELHGQDPLKLNDHRTGQDQLDPAVDRLLEDPARRSGGDERRDEDIGVAGDPQDQWRPERDSSTNASLSSGPTPTASARSRP